MSARSSPAALWRRFVRTVRSGRLRSEPRPSLSPAPFFTGRGGNPRPELTTVEATAKPTLGVTCDEAIDDEDEFDCYEDAVYRCECGYCLCPDHLAEAENEDACPACGSSVST